LPRGFWADASSGAAGGATNGIRGTDATEADSPQARMRGRDLRLAHEGLVAAAVFRPEHLRAIRDVFSPSEISDEGLRAVYEAALSLAAQGLTPSPEAVHRLVAANGPAGTALAGLPDDLPFDDWVPDRVRFMQAQRSSNARLQTVLQLLGGSGVPPQDLPPGGTDRY
jgi:hypothetical protein